MDSPGRDHGCDRGCTQGCRRGRFIDADVDCWSCGAMVVVGGRGGGDRRTGDGTVGESVVAPNGQTGGQARRARHADERFATLIHTLKVFKTFRVFLS